MHPIDRYIDAATRDNTRKAYRAAVEHFEAEWGGFLPATADSISRYLVNYADTLSVNTLKQRLAALSHWHVDQGFPDPVKTPMVKKVLRGIRELHPSQEKQARPLQLEELNRVVQTINHTLNDNDDKKSALRPKRDKALILLGFWRGFRSDELSRLSIEHIQVSPGEGMTLFLPRSKTDRLNQGRSYRTPALSRLCPVSAYLDWVQAAGLKKGPVFRRITRWGALGDQPLNPDSLVGILRSVLDQAGILDSHRYSSHSLRRGFATWAGNDGWDVKSLMEYVGWKDVKSAMRYIDGVDHYAQQRIEAGVQKRLDE